MSKIYAIVAYESQYQGLHGMEETEVIECENFEIASSVAEEMSGEVISDYGLEPWADLEEDELENWDESDYEIAWQEALMYEIYEVTNTKGLSIEEMNEELWNNREDFLKECCIDC